MTAQDPNRIPRAFRTATALAAARWRGDTDAMTDLWNHGVEEDPAAFCQAMACLPTVMVDEFARASGVTVDWNNYFTNALRAMAAEDN